ncbi:MAG: metalloregulator ArsR/SmtB family transcription factor [Candidatus Levybacteria bacterium]|nr:metalloregulator ArsR/SmtB family transcription factor [Candidatus Levybacteria bacterium]
MLTQDKILKFKSTFKNNSLIESKSLIAGCLGDPTCLKILYVLAREKEVCPSDLTEILNISMPAVSHQLGKLRQIGIVSTKRMGKTICYALAKGEEAKLVKKLIKNI